MKPVSLRACLRRLHQPAMLFLAALPLLLLPVCQYTPNAMPAAKALFASSAVLLALLTAMPGRLRGACAVLFSAALIAAGAAALPLDKQPALLALPVFSAAVMLLSLPLAGRTVSDTPPVFYFSGIVSHLFAYAVIRFTRGEVRLRFDTLQPALTAAFAAYLLLLLLSLNRISLDNATMARTPLPASMRRANTLLTLSFLALSAFIASLPLAVRLLLACRDLIFSALRTAFFWLSRLLPDAPGAGGGMGAAMMPMLAAEAEYAEPSLFALLAEKLMLAVTYLFLLGGTLLLLRLLARLALRVIRIIAARLARYSAAVSGDYIDEITDTRGEDGRSTSYAGRIKKRFAPSAAPDAPGARIRWRYARLLRRNRSWSDSSTARENLPEEAAALYERARYSNLPVTQEDAERFDASVRRP